jgi:hypothetical protein
MMFKGHVDICFDAGIVIAGECLVDQPIRIFKGGCELIRQYAGLKIVSDGQ